MSTTTHRSVLYVCHSPLIPESASGRTGARRGVEQPGSSLGSYPRGRRFKSCPRHQPTGR